VRVIISITSLLASNFPLSYKSLSCYNNFQALFKTEWLNYPLPKDIQKEIYRYKVFDNNWKRERKRSFLSFYFFLEVMLIAIHPIPYYDMDISLSSINLTDKSKMVEVHYKLSDFLLAFMFLRVLLLIRSVFNYTMFTDLYAKRLW
jgi:hypothetical protein